MNNFGYNAGGWRVEKHPRFLADTTGDGRADIVGFGNAGVWVANIAIPTASPNARNMTPTRRFQLEVENSSAIGI